MKNKNSLNSHLAEPKISSKKDTESKNLLENASVELKHDFRPDRDLLARVFIKVYHRLLNQEREDMEIMSGTTVRDVYLRQLGRLTEDIGAKTVIGYARVSTKMQTCGVFTSIEAQKQYIGEYIARHSDMKLERIYEDPAKSAANTRRPGYQEMLRRVEQGDIYAIIAYKLDRINRNDDDFRDLERFLTSHGTRLIYTNDVNPEPTPQGRFIAKITMATASMEREQTALRLAEKHIATIKEGLRLGGMLPIGYCSAGENGIISIEQSGAEHIKDIYAEFLSGKTPAEVAVYMTLKYGKTPIRIAKGTGRPYGGAQYSENHVRRILSNPLYAGFVSLNLGNGKDGCAYIELFEGKHDAIIPRAEWERAQKILALMHKSRSGKYGHRDTDRYALKGILKCSCGSPMIVGESGRMRKDGVKYDYYICARKHKVRSFCDCRSTVALRIIESVVFAALERFLKREADKKAFAMKVKDGREVSLEKDLNSHRNDIVSLQKALSNILDGMGRLDYPEDVALIIRSRIELITCKTIELTEKIKLIENELAVIRGYGSLDSLRIKSLFANLDQLQASVSDDDKKDLIKMCFGRIVINGEAERISYIREYTLELNPTEQFSSLIPPMDVKFRVDKSSGCGFWEIYSPFRHSTVQQAQKKENGPPNKHFIHEVIKWDKEIIDKNLTLTRFAQIHGMKISMVARKVKMLRNLNTMAIEYILGCNSNMALSKLSFRKLEGISKLPKERHLEAVLQRAQFLTL